jgi:hypothetical protein
MVRERKHDVLHSLMKDAISCGIPELKSFVAGSSETTMLSMPLSVST